MFVEGVITKILITLLLVLLPSLSSAEEKPEIFVQLGHSKKVISFAFTPNGRYALSGSWEQTLRLLEVAGGSTDWAKVIAIIED